ncbi:hypothetical protein BCR44DRAFT_44620 [Catenaria anguillulae PL171]|uniref:Apple domain-containing protein n=1 Tax=Catenaria anguillulae PL171 TaxID=765915 RepID=A0A1Y2HU64_9FUNG|nr:hypothetical protein BCR44DRAFT_44620 [Catenaria anguillulae PL171]
MSIARTLPALAIVVAVLLATVALAAPSNLQVASALTKRADCPAPFFFAGGVDLPYVFDAGQSPIAANGDWRECAMVAQQAGKMGAIYRYDTKTCYFKNFPRNGAVTYDYDGRAFANFDIYGFDVNSNGYSSYDAARSVYPTVVVKNAGKWWAKKLPKCDQCVMILVSDIRC